MNDIQKLKRKVRNSKAWKTLRHEKNVEQKSLDPITGGKLTKTANLHHMNTDPSEYCNLENKEDFVMLNKMTHDTLHFCFNYQMKDEGFLDRLVYWTMKMVERNRKND